MRLAILILGALALTSCSAPTGDNAFVTEVISTPGLTSSMSRYDLIQTGHGMCQVMAEGEFSRNDLIAAMSSPNTKFEPDVTAVMLDAAQGNLCPQYSIPRFSRG